MSHRPDVDGGNDWGEVREFVSDEVDDTGPRNRLAISMGGNGDWYVEVRTGTERFGPAVRISTHGGASSSHPGLGTAIARAYRAIGHEPIETLDAPAPSPPPSPSTRVDLDELERLVAAMTPKPFREEPITYFDAPTDWSYLLGPEWRRDHGTIKSTDAAGIVALVNAAPELLRLARVGQATVAYAAADVLDADAWLKAMQNYDAAVAAYRAAKEGR